MRAQLGVDLRQLLESAAGVELLSLDPTQRNVPEPVIRDDEDSAPEGENADTSGLADNSSRADKAGAEEFQGYRVLGRARIVDADERRALIEALYAGINAWGGEEVECFIPRHGIRLSNGADFVICFECKMIEIRRPSDSARLASINVSPVAEPAFDAALRRHGLKKAPRRRAPK